jgi:hypothetical protein
MDLPLTGLAALIDGLVLLFFFYRLNKSMSEDNSFLKYFKWYTLFFGLFYFFFSVPLILNLQDNNMIGWGYLVGHVFAYIGFGYLARIWLLIAKPSFDSRIVFYIYLILGAILTTLNVMYLNYPIVESGIVDWKQNSLVGTLIIIFGLTAFLPAAVLFIRESIRQPRNRKRYLLIGIAFLMIIISGPLHDVATVSVLKDITTTTIVLLFADIITTSGFLLMFWGVMSGIKSETTIKKVGK